MRSASRSVTHPVPGETLQKDDCQMDKSRLQDMVDDDGLHNDHHHDQGVLRLGGDGYLSKLSFLPEIISTTPVSVGVFPTMKANSYVPREILAWQTTSRRCQKTIIQGQPGYGSSSSKNPWTQWTLGRHTQLFPSPKARDRRECKSQKVRVVPIGYMKRKRAPGETIGATAPPRGRRPNRASVLRPCF